MGISFITEGAIPFAAKNPKVIIPASMIGASIAGMLAAAFGITLAAPHGGIFVFALVKSTLFADPGLSIGLGITLYLVAIIIGSIITAIMINIFTKLFNKNKGNKNAKIKLEKKTMFYSKKNKQSNINKLNIFENKSTIKDKIKVCFIQ
jgi:PTS system fructose-specific IIC component